MIPSFLHKLGPDSYAGSLARNFVANALPALYIVLSRLWLARLDTNNIAIGNTYVYVSSILEALNEGLPRAGWSVITDRSTRTLSQRYQLAWLLVSSVAALAFVVTVCMIGAASSLAESFVPYEVRAMSYTYIRLSSVSAFCGVVVNTLSIATRALDEPDIPLAVQSVKFMINIVLDMLIISNFRVTTSEPTVQTQAITRLICDVTATTAGLVYFVVILRRRTRTETAFANGNQASSDAEARGMKLRHLRELWRVGWPFQLEVIPRTLINLWQASQFVGLGLDFAVAYGVFFTVRAGILFAPLLAIEASCYTFVGHAWGAIVGGQRQGLDISIQDFAKVRRYVCISVVLVLVPEIFFYVLLSFGPGFHLANFLSGSVDSANLFVEIWRRLNWAYVFLTVFFQTTALFVVAAPRWYLYQSLITNLLYYLPCNIISFKLLSGDSLRWDIITLAAVSVFPLYLATNICSTWLWLSRFLHKHATVQKSRG